MIKAISIFILSVTLVFAHHARATPNGEAKVLYVKEASDKIILDGRLEEDSWINADVATGFWQIWPTDSLAAKTTTEVRITYDDNFLYVGAKLHNYNDQPYIIRSLRRDFQGPEIDGFHVNFDTFFDQNNAFNFAVNPYGVQREGTITNGGNGRIDVAWDNKWFSKVETYDGYWIAEMAIPFKTIRYKEGIQKWGFNSFRLDGNANERVAWSPVPLGFSLSSLAFDGELIFDKPLKKPGANVAIIPYVAGGYNEDFEEGTGANNDFNVGGDAKIGITPGLNLDLTVNPDFSQVEVDRQQTNITRFELFFPERRQFFLENADLFSDFGGRSIRPFFSRRIGIAEDTATGLNVQNKIQAGLRLSGKIDNKWRVGLLNMQAAPDNKNGLPGTNYGMAVIQRNVLSNSTVSAFLVNKQALFNDRDKEYAVPLDHFNRVVGGEFNYRSPNGKLRSSGFYHGSFSEVDTLEQEFARGASVNYSTRKYSLFTLYRQVGQDFEAEVGFVPRVDFKRSFSRATYRFLPVGGFMSSHGPSIEYEHIWNSELSRTDQAYSVGYEFNFLDQSRITLEGKREYIYLFDDFDPTRKGEGEELQEGTDYTYHRFFWNYGSNQRSKFFYNFNGSVGSFFNGDIFSLDGNINYRLQPIAVFSIDYNYNRIRLPEPYNDADLFLIGPRFDLTFTKQLFFTTLIQYNNQLENINLNARLQWRYKPVSDFFLVYTDNYLSGPNFLQARNRAIVFKATYWLNL